MTDKQAEKLRQAMAISDLLTLVDDGYVLGKNTIQEAGSLIFDLLHQIKMEDSPAQPEPARTKERLENIPKLCIKCNAWFSPQNEKQVYCKTCDVKKKGEIEKPIGHPIRNE